MTDDVLKEAQSCYNEAKEAHRDNQRYQREDLKFYGGDQWSESDSAARAADGRPALTINRMPQFVHQVTNEIRQNTPSIKCLPMGEGSDEKVAEIWQGIIRNIEYVSRADIAYDMAGEYAVKCGQGFIRLDHDYIHEDSFDQHILIKSIHDPLSVMLDPFSVESDGSDAKYAFVSAELSEDAAKKLYGEKVTSFDLKDTTGKSDKKTVTIVEYFKLVEEDKVIALMPDGSVIEAQNIPNGLQPVKVRKATRKTVKRYKLSGDAILEETSFPGSYIPIIPVYGELQWTNGKREIFSLIRFAKDPQRLFNFWKSEEAEYLKLGKEAPWVMAEGQAGGYAGQWQNPQGKRVLFYKQTDVDGNAAPAPQRQPPTPIPSGILQASIGTVEDMKATMGIYDASLGQRSNETSGVAIESRKVEGQMANLHFADNLRRSIAHCGRVILSMGREVLDTPRILRIINKEEQPESVAINGSIDGFDKFYDLHAGLYDVAVVTGMNYTTKKQEAFALLSQLAQSYPPLMEIAGDLVMKNSDIPGADAISERLKKMVAKIDPSMIESEDGEDQEVSPQAQAKLAQMQQQIQQDQQVIMQLQQALQEAQVAVQSAEQTAQNKQGDMALKAQDQEIKAQSEAAKIEIEKMKIALDAQKLQLEEKKLELDTKKTEFETLKSVYDSVDMKEGNKEDEVDSIDILQAKLQAAIEAKQNKEMQEYSEQQKQAEEKAQEEAGRQQKQMETAAVLQSMAQITQAVNNLTVAVATPKQVLRDADGKVVGVG